MTRPAVEVADILRAQGSRFLDKYRASFSFQQLKALRAIQNCRTAALGGHLDACPIRHFGFPANRHRTGRLALYRVLACATPADPSSQAEHRSTREPTLWHCPRCDAVMVVIQQYTSAGQLSQCGRFDSS